MMLKNKQANELSVDKKPPKKKNSVKKLYSFLTQKLEKTLAPRDSITAIMHMHSGHFGQLDTTHFTNIDKNYQRKQSSNYGATLSERSMEDSSIKKPDTQEQHRLWKLQVSKCYRHIPTSFFSEDYQLIPSLVNRNRQKCLSSQFELVDYFDEVEFNLNSHVNNKFKEFFTFITSMNEIEQLVESNLSRLKYIRSWNQHLQKTLLQKADYIRSLRIRADNLARFKTVVENAKRMVAMPHDIRQAFPRDKTKALYIFNMYKSLHDRSRIYCCLNKKTPCKFEQIREYLRSNFQVAFTKSFWGYITQVIEYDREDLQSIFGLNKKQFMTTPNFLQSLSEKLKVEESVWEQQPHQLIIKENIEAQINWIAVNGFTFCNLTCSVLIKDLLQYMNSFQKNFLSDLMDKIKESFDMPTANNLLTLSKNREMLISELQSLFEKVTFSKYIRVLQMYSDVLKKVVKRSLSIVYRILSSFCKIKPSNLRELEDSLLEVANTVLEFSSIGLLSIIKLKRISGEFDIASFKNLIIIFEEWSQFSEQIHQTYLQPLPVFGTSIQKTKGLIESLAIESLKKSYMQAYLNNLHNFSLSNRLKKALQCDNWQQVDIEPDYFQSLGYLLEGEQFLLNRKKKMLASSILFERKPASTTHIQLPGNQFRVTNKEIVIKEKRLKTTNSTLQLLQTLEEYLKIHQTCQELGKEIADKLIELLKSYSSYLQELILRGKALQLKCIKGNSITARHLSLSYLALEIILELLPSINKHLPLPVQQHQKLVQKLHSHQDEIVKKFHSVMICTMEQQCRLVDLKPPVPSEGTKKILDHIRSMYEILSEYFSDEDMSKFFSRHLLRKYIDTLSRLKPSDNESAYLKRQQISYFIKQSAQYENILTDYDKLISELNRMLTVPSK